MYRTAVLGVQSLLLKGFTRPGPGWALLRKAALTYFPLYEHIATAGPSV